MDLGLTGHTAVVTGASKGIGLAIAQGLAAEGCAAQIVSRDRPAIESAAQNLRSQYAVEVNAHALDLSRSESVAAMLEATGVPDILVNNAGAIPGGDLQAVDETRWRAAWDLKVFGYINLPRLLCRHARAGQGRDHQCHRACRGPARHRVYRGFDWQLGVECLHAYSGQL